MHPDALGLRKSLRTHHELKFKGQLNGCRVSDTLAVMKKAVRMKGGLKLSDSITCRKAYSSERPKKIHLLSSDDEFRS